VGIARTDLQGILQKGLPSDISWVIPSPGFGWFYADPIALEMATGIKVFCERYNYWSGKGDIYALHYSPDGGWVPRADRGIEEPFHLSYPAIVDMGDCKVCIPESCEAGVAYAYPLSADGEIEVKSRKVFLGFEIADPTFVLHNGYWYLFGAAAKESQYTLRIWFAETLEGPWTAHPANPVKCDVQTARPAGPVIRSNGRLYRPSQDSSKSYGSSANIMEIVELSPKAFMEVCSRKIEPDARWPYSEGIHTLTLTRDGILIDAKRVRISPLAPLIRVANVARVRWRRRRTRVEPKLAKFESGIGTAQRLAFVISNMVVGGAARVASILCAEWVASGHEVHLITFEKPGTASIYSIDPNVVRHQIGLSVSAKNLVGVVSNNAARVIRLRRTLKEVRPTAVISFLLNANITAVLAARGLGIPVLISDRNHPQHDKISTVRGRVREFVYPYADRICVQTENIRTWYHQNLHLDAVVIPNPVRVVNVGAAARPMREISRRRRATSIGRLAYQKGLDRLIDAFALICTDVPDWELVIYGTGEERGSLERQIAGHELEHRILLMGMTTDAMGELFASDLYVHAARYEGYPNAILEALAAGLCVVATDCPGATAEILAGGEYGILVPDGEAESLAAGMKKAMTDNSVRTCFARRAPQAITNIAAADVAQRWLREIGRCQGLKV